MPKINKKYFSYFLIVFCFCTSAQTNLVPNFAFENYSSCPNSGDQANYSIGWSKYSNNISTPDYFNACSSFSTFGVPKSSAIYQTDHRNCSAYMGLVTWAYSTVNYRECVGLKLSQPLLIGQKYYLSFYTVMGEGYFSGDYFNLPSNNIGLRLSTLPYNPINPIPIDNFSHLRSLTVISDTTNWVLISGSIVADSTYNYLILGNFYNDSNTDTTTLSCGTCYNYASYYLIDDVCVSTDSTLCNGGIDALPCTVSIKEDKLNDQFNIFPNPANDVLIIQGVFGSKLIIYNMLGEEMFKSEIKSKSISVNCSEWPNGLYFIETKEKRSKIIINH